MVSINNLSGKRVPKLALKRAVSFTLQREVSGKKEVSLVIAPVRIIKELNYRYLKKDSPTDVLAFPLREETGPAKDLLGEIFICPDVALQQARERGHSLREELILLAIHGTLHLLGYRDEQEEEKEIMEQKEKEILRLLGEDDKIV